MSALPTAEQVQVALEPALALPELERQRGLLQRLLVDYARAEAQGEQALTVALVGATGAGKSTLLNALAGARVAEEGVNRPTSRQAVIFAPEDAELSTLTLGPVRVERYRVRPDAPWAGQVFVDAPDLNSVEPTHRQVARAVLETADVALLVLHRSSVAEAAQADFLAEFARRRRLALVLNFADELGPGSREALKAQARQLFSAQWELPPGELPCFALSARRARLGEADAGELAPLVAWLRALGERGVAGGVRRGNAAAGLEGLRRVALPALQRAEGVGAATARELHTGLAAVESALASDLAERLEAAKGHLRDLARRQVASRGWGPLSLALRWSGWSSGGLAAGTLLLRQSVPVGLAVAGASAALERLARHTRSQAAEATVVDGQEDDDGTAAQSARAALLGARSLAQQNGFTPEALGVPTAAQLRDGVVEARAEAWRFLQGRALVESVGRWWRWARFLLFPLFNLAFAGLAVDVIYRVGRAYYLGQYLEGRYYLNALALAVLWAALGAGAVGLTLRGAVARARSLALQHFTRRLGELRMDWGQDVSHAQAPWKRARALLEAGP